MRITENITNLINKAIDSLDEADYYIAETCFAFDDLASDSNSEWSNQRLWDCQESIVSVRNILGKMICNNE